MAKMIGHIECFCVREIEEPIFHQKMWVFGWQQKQSANMGSLGDSSSAENRGSLEPYIPLTSIMGVPPPG